MKNKADEINRYLSDGEYAKYYILLTALLLRSCIDENSIKQLLPEVISFIGPSAKTQQHKETLYESTLEPNFNKDEVIKEIRSYYVSLDDNGVDLLTQSALYTTAEIILKGSSRIKSDFNELHDRKSLAKVCTQVGIHDEQLDALFALVEYDLNIITGDFDNASKISNTLKEKAKSGLVHVALPGTILYFSGVSGLSAAGITSGLASIGLGAGMLGGIAVLGVVAIFTKRLLDQIFPDLKTQRKLLISNLLDRYTIGSQISLEDDDQIARCFGTASIDLAYQFIQAHNFWYCLHVASDLPDTINRRTLEETVNYEIPEESLRTEVIDTILKYYRPLPGDENRLMLRKINVIEAVQLRELFKSIKYDNIVSKTKRTASKGLHAISKFTQNLKK
ncbi:hypothetical protein D6779_12130 [Candidatus Parcubacteria bacterium]|nr:MAG: hypothetical protein D6779_12130 [Candidatus Parcubacteria bacterium]